MGYPSFSTAPAVADEKEVSKTRGSAEKFVQFQLAACLGDQALAGFPGWLGFTVRGVLPKRDGAAEQGDGGSSGIGGKVSDVGKETCLGLNLHHGKGAIFGGSQNPFKLLAEP